MAFGRKSRWEIHREEMKARDREAKEREAKRDKAAEEHQERMERFSEEASEMREKYDRELAETRRFNAQMLMRLEKTYAGLDRSLKLMGEQLESNTGEVRAQTKAIFSLLDYFKGTNGGPPV
jgi:chromosome segregation ATPase